MLGSSSQIVQPEPANQLICGRRLAVPGPQLLQARTLRAFLDFLVLEALMESDEQAFEIGLLKDDSEAQLGRCGLSVAPGFPGLHETVSI